VYRAACSGSALAEGAWCGAPNWLLCAGRSGRIHHLPTVPIRRFGSGSAARA